MCESDVPAIPPPASLDLATFDRLITAHEVAAFVGVDYKTVLRHKELRSFSLDLGHRIVRWYPLGVCRWLEGKRKRVPRRSSAPRERLQAWASLLDGSAGKKYNETELLPDFVFDVFLGTLGYTAPVAQKKGGCPTGSLG